MHETGVFTAVHTHFLYTLHSAFIDVFSCIKLFKEILLAHLEGVERREGDVSKLLYDVTKLGYVRILAIVHLIVVTKCTYLCTGQFDVTIRLSVLNTALTLILLTHRNKVSTIY